MYSAVLSGALFGMECYLVQVEVCIANGLPVYEMVGCLSSESKEAKERVRVALQSSGIAIPPKKITINLSPSSRRKTGTAFDLPIAVGILKSLGLLKEEQVRGVLFLGELGLNGNVRPVPGVLPLVLEAKSRGITKFVVPKKNTEEILGISGIAAFGAETIKQVITFFEEGGEKNSFYYYNEETETPMEEEISEFEEMDFSEIYGQSALRRAAEVAAAGFHHLVMIGPPGCGKSMIAKRIPGILPRMSPREQLEVSQIYSASGKLEGGLKKERPFFSPHHTITSQAFFGGGKVPLPGVVSLAHKGVLFLDELPEFKREVLELLRQPMEEKKIQVTRNYGTVTYPADCMLLAALNPCPCGYYPNRERCRCKEGEIRRYLHKISGPIWDRIDICAEVSSVEYQSLSGSSKRGESSKTVRERVCAARKIQQERYQALGDLTNGELKEGKIEEFCYLGDSEKAFLEQIRKVYPGSMRSYFRILKLARTIADLDASEKVKEEHLTEACYYRSAGEKYWGGRTVE